MPRKRNPILRKAWDHLKAFSITPMAKVRKPITRKLLLFRKNKRFRLLRHYNYAFISEYEFSPSNTPLFHHPRRPFKKRTRFMSLLCGGSGAESVMDGGFGDEFEILSAEDGMEPPPELLEWSEEEDSVDRKAEKFIERFYEEMRLQRQESIMQYKEMLNKSCS